MLGKGYTFHAEQVAIHEERVSLPACWFGRRYKGDRITSVIGPASGCFGDIYPPVCAFFTKQNGFRSGREKCLRAVNRVSSLCFILWLVTRLSSGIVSSFVFLFGPCVRWSLSFSPAVSSFSFITPRWLRG